MALGTAAAAAAAAAAASVAASVVVVLLALLLLLRRLLMMMVRWILVAGGPPPRDRSSRPAARIRPCVVGCLWRGVCVRYCRESVECAQQAKQSKKACVYTVCGWQSLKSCTFIA